MKAATAPTTTTSPASPASNVCLQVTCPNVHVGYEHRKGLRLTCQEVYGGYAMKATQLVFTGPIRHARLEDTLDFVNTLEYSRRGPIEHLPTLETALSWLAERGLLEDEFAAGGAEGGPASARAANQASPYDDGGRSLVHEGRVPGGGLADGGLADETASEGGAHLAPPSLERIRRARAALRAVVDAIVERRSPDPSHLAELNRLLAGQPGPVLVAAPDGVALAARPVPDPIEGALTRLVEPLIELLEHGDRERLRTCANPTCRWAFYDQSRGRRRRWCEMATCGNRAKAARHRARRATGDESEHPSASA